MGPLVPAVANIANGELGLSYARHSCFADESLCVCVPCAMSVPHPKATQSYEAYSAAEAK